MELIIEKTPTFDLRQTLDSGQVFRYKEIEKDKWLLYAWGERAFIEEKNGAYYFDCTDAAYFQNYLDFDTKYDIIQMKTQDKGLISSAIEFGKGIHLLKQNPFETIFSFLISQNNNIPRIKSIIERVCDALGEDKGGYHAFPTVDAISCAGQEFFHSVGAGYRAEYLVKTAKTLLETDMSGWDTLKTDDLRGELIKLHGVGRKVADCILLFGYARYDVFPVDTWILKIFSNEYPKVDANKLSGLLVKKYGNYSGFVQQWLYYFGREEKKYGQKPSVIIR